MAEPAIVIAPYDEAWPEEFTELGSALRTTLGDLALRIDHIGSTAVPGLAAKDRIDIQVTVADLDATSLRPRLESAGFVWVDDVASDHRPAGVWLAERELAKLLTKTGRDLRPANCHIRQTGRDNQRYPLLNRDYLRATPEAARTYEQIKRTLARMFPSDSESYYAIKDPIFDLIMQSAERWATDTGWEPGPSDA